MYEIVKRDNLCPQGAYFDVRNARSIPHCATTVNHHQGD